jgi:4-amino-4-deoxy-L-arabinose transferase-like glycosyltransferase
VHARPRFDAGRSRGVLAVLAALLLILVAGSAFRVIGLDAGRPFVYHPDEGVVVKAAMGMVATGDPNPHTFLYPSLLFDLMAALVALGHAIFGWPLTTDQSWLFVTEALPEQFDAYLAGRWLVAAIGIATIALTFLAGRRLGGPLSGLLAATVVAVAPVHVESSGAVTTDVPVTFFGVLVLLATIRALAAPHRRRWWIVAAIAVGLATSSKWNGLALGIVPTVAYLASVRGPDRLRQTVGSPTPWLMLAAGIIALVVTTPSIVLAPGEVLDWLGRQSAAYTTADSVVARGQTSPNGIDVSLADAVGGIGPILAAAGIAGVVGLFASRRSIEVAMGLFIAVYLAVLTVPVLHFARNALPIVPYVAIAVGLLPGRLARWRERRAGPPPSGDGAGRFAVVALATLVIALALIPALADDVATIRRSGATDTRSIAYDWMLEHLPRNAIVAREQYTPQIRQDQFRLRNHDGLYQRDMAWYRAQRVRYVVASSDIDDRFVDNPATPFRSAFYHELFSMPELFRVEAGEQRPGPTIRIFDLSAAARD